jgi:hypothetical protein
MAQAPSFSVTASGRNILVSGVAVNAARDYTLFDTQGRVLRRGVVDGANFAIPVERAGNYLVRIDNQVRRVSVR